MEEHEIQKDNKEKLLFVLFLGLTILLLGVTFFLTRGKVSGGAKSTTNLVPFTAIWIPIWVAMRRKNKDKPPSKAVISIVIGLLVLGIAVMFFTLL